MAARCCLTVGAALSSQALNIHCYVDGSMRSSEISFAAMWGRLVTKELHRCPALVLGRFRYRLQFDARNRKHQIHVRYGEYWQCYGCLLPTTKGKRCGY